MKISPMLLTTALFFLTAGASHITYAVNTIAQEYFNSAEMFKEEGDTQKAIQYYKEALSIDEDYFDAAFTLAHLLYAEDKTSEAIEYYEKSLKMRPRSSVINFNLGICYNKRNDREKAIFHFKQAAELNPVHYAKGYTQAGLLLEKEKRKDEAAACFERAIEGDPDDFTALYRLAGYLREQDKFDEAIRHYRKSVELQPKNISVILQLANTLNMAEQPKEALDWYRRILEINPETHQALYNFGYTLKKLGHFKEAIEIYNRLLEEKPDYAQPHFSRSLCRLQLGDFERGWPEYEWRWAAYDETPKKFAQPLWDGSDPAGKTILLYAEQGLGDTFQFIRYAQLIKERGGKVVVETQKPLKDILSLCDYIDSVYKRGEQLPYFDLQAPLMSLPMLFDTRVETVPQNIPYLKADQRLVEQWRDKLSRDKNFKIGICWQGNATYRSQYLRLVVSAKSMLLETFAPLANMEGVSLYNLQKINGTKQLDDASFFVHSFGDDFDSTNGRFMDTAAVIKSLDLVVTIDTSISHLAAALGTPTWILLPHPSDWRWIVGRTDTPWYPNVRLFKQPKTGDWESAMHDVVNALQPILNVRRGSTVVPATPKPIKKKPQPVATKTVPVRKPFAPVSANQSSPRLRPTGASFDTLATPALRMNGEKEVYHEREKRVEWLGRPKRTYDVDTEIETDYEIAPRINKSFSTKKTTRPLADVLDELTIINLQLEDANDATSIRKLMKKLADLNRQASWYEGESNNINELKDSLKQVNKKLLELEQQQKDTDMSVADPEFREIARKAYYMHDLKNNIKNSISTLSKTSHKE